MPRSGRECAAIGQPLRRRPRGRSVALGRGRRVLRRARGRAPDLRRGGRSRLQQCCLLQGRRACALRTRGVPRTCLCSRSPSSPAMAPPPPMPYAFLVAPSASLRASHESRGRQSSTASGLSSEVASAEASEERSRGGMSGQLSESGRPWATALWKIDAPSRWPLRRSVPAAPSRARSGSRAGW